MADYELAHYVMQQSRGKFIPVHQIWKEGRVNSRWLRAPATSVICTPDFGDPGCSSLRAKAFSTC
jgi:hypothetical protein